jgi:hypothetical protein
MRVRILLLAVLAAGGAAAGCTAVLGDFTIGNGPGVDASSGDDAPAETGPLPGDGSTDAPGATDGASEAASEAGIIAPPQLVAPLSTALVTSQTPTFHWKPAAGATGAQVDICRDRSCTSIVTSFTANGSSGAPASALAKGVYFWRAHGMVGSTVGTTTGPVWEVRVGAHSAGVNVAVSTSWGSVFDANGDGFADLAVAATLADAVYVYTSMGAGGLPSSPTTVITGPASSSFGSTLASAGDVNGDGFDDLVIGANTVGGTYGAAYVYLGGPNGVSPMATMTLTRPGGGMDGDYFGQVGGAGDVNGDGYADVIVGAPGVNGMVGAVYVYLGGPSGLSSTPATTLAGSGTQPYMGSDVAGAGDVNGDGYGDIIVAADLTNNSTGAAYVYLGSSSGVVTSKSIALAGMAAGDAFGVSVACADDVNGDGYADVIVSAAGASNNGAAYVFLGGPSGTSTKPSPVLPAPAPGGLYGAKVSGASDVNGDGFADVVVGAPDLNSGVGVSYVYLGSPAGLSSSPTQLNGTGAAPDWFGSAASGLGDVNGDGFGDVAIGAYQTNNQAGAAYVYYGSAGGVPTSASTSFTQPAGGNFGKGVL